MDSFPIFLIRRVNQMITVGLVIGICITEAFVALGYPTSSSPQKVLVCSRQTDTILEFDTSTGAYVGALIPQGSGGVDEPHGVTLGPDGHLYVCSMLTDNVLRYNGRTGESMGVFASGGGLDMPVSSAFGPDGNLYVTDYVNGRILRYNGTTGAYIDSFATVGGYANAHTLVFGPDGNLYVTDFYGSHVYRYNGITGASMGSFISGGSLDRPTELIFGPDGNLYVSSRDNDKVLRYNGQTGQFIDTFVSSSSGGLDWPEGLAFGPDGNLYVCNTAKNNILRYNGTTGAFMDVFVQSNAGGLKFPSSIIFITSTPLNATLTAHIEPLAPFTTNDLQCVTEFDNIGGYTNLDWSYHWFRNGAELLDGMLVSGDYLPVTGPALSHYFTAKNETFYCAVHVTDGTSSLTARTDPVTIQNAPPTAPTVEIRPAEPRPGQDLGINILIYSTDPDGDEVDYRIDWYESENGGGSWIHKQEFTDHAFISGIYLQQGDLWRVVVTPFELPASPAKPGQALTEGESGWDQVYVGENTRPAITVESPGAGDLVAAPGALIKWSAADSDGDPLRVELYYDTDTVKGGCTLIAADLPASGALTWTPPGQKPAVSFSDLNNDGSVNHADLFQMAAQWQNSVEGARYHIFARVWDAKNAYGESFSPGEVVAPPAPAAVNEGLLTLIGQWHAIE